MHCKPKPCKAYRENPVFITGNPCSHCRVNPCTSLLGIAVQYWYFITEFMLVESRERLNYLVHAMHCIGYIYLPMLTPYIVFLLKNVTWFSSKVFPKHCIVDCKFTSYVQTLFFICFAIFIRFSCLATLIFPKIFLTPPLCFTHEKKKK